MIRDDERRPRNFVERMVWLHGRSFWLAFFAGISAFVLVVAGVWIAARTDPEKGRIVSDLVNDYLLAAFGFVLAYVGKNGWVESVHAKAKNGAAAEAVKRQSGNVHAEEGPST